jgi:threonine dehydrogenase-like Zn-dependent dehydrogenase
VKAACWMGTTRVQLRDVPDPKILNPRDAIVKISLTAICGSDLHLYNGYVPTMKRGDILGHEFMGEVVEVGSGVENLAVGDRVVVPFPIACGNCMQCEDGKFSVCENSNPNAWLAEKMFGHSTAGIFGYSHLTGGYAGGQAQYVRVPYADTGPIKIPSGLADEQVLFLSDIFPTAWMAAEHCGIQPGQIVAVWGCGPVGQLAIQSAYLLGAEKVIAIDRLPYRLRMAREQGGAVTLDYEDVDVYEALRELTGGRGPDACIECVGLEADTHGLVDAYDRAKQALKLESDRPAALRQAILTCKPGGTVSVAGVFGGFVDKFPAGAFMNKALTLKTGQTHVQRYLRPLLDRIENGDIDPSFVISHRLRLDDIASGYELFVDKEEDCMKVVLTP